MLAYAYVQITRSRIRLSLFKRLASVGLVGLSGASLRAAGNEVIGWEGIWVVGWVERKAGGWQAFKVLAVVLVGLDVLSECVGFHVSNAGYSHMAHRSMCTNRFVAYRC